VRVDDGRRGRPHGLYRLRRQPARDAAAEEAFVSTEAQSTDDVIEADEDAEYEGKPTASDVTCEACGHGEAWYDIRQTASADEPPTRFLRCKECGHTWREYN